jgi:hypothetical protein
MLENTETVEVTDTTSPEVVEDESLPENITLDDLMSIDEEKYPEFAQDTNHTGMKSLNHWMQHMPEEVRKHVANLRADYTRKTQEISNIKKELQLQKESVVAKDEHILNGNLAQKLKTLELDKEYDLYDPEGMKSEIKRQAALMLKEMLEPAQEELNVKARQIQLDNFKKENPDLTNPEYKQPILDLLKTRTELKLEDAYYIVKAKLDSEKLSKERQAIAAQKTARKEVALKSAAGSRTSPTGQPQFKSAWDAYNYHKSQSK